METREDEMLWLLINCCSLLYTWLGALSEGWYLTWTAREWWLHHQGLQWAPAAPERESSSYNLHENGQQSNCVGGIDSKPLALHHVNAFHQLDMWIWFHTHAYHQHLYTSYCLMTDDTQSSLYVTFSCSTGDRRKKFTVLFVQFLLVRVWVGE